MYRKILFISINLFQEMELFSKTTILIFFSFCSFLITFYARPFLLKEMNLLEFYSNLSACLTLFSGAVYITNTNEFIKGLSFVNVIIVNTFFGYIWIISTIKIIFHVHFQKLENHFPKLAIFILAMTESFEKVNFTFNLFIYFKNLKRNFLIHKSTLLKISSDEEKNNNFVAERGKTTKVIHFKSLAN